MCTCEVYSFLSTRSHCLQGSVRWRVIGIASKLLPQRVLT